jgi:ferrous iron transport protein B
MKILLAGNPNVGKSSLFTRLAGIDVICSNYPGKTVETTCGTLSCAKANWDIVDLPGTYSLMAQNDAEKVAVEMIPSGDVIIDVIDATNLERNLYLTFELMEYGKPMLIALNMVDDARHRGVEIDVKKLEEMLGVPVVKTVAVTGEGIKELVEKIPQAKKTQAHRTEEERWKEVGKIVHSVQKLRDKKHSLLEILEDATIKPLTGIPIALIVLFLAFQIVVTAGNYTIENVLDPFFYGAYGPLVKGIVEPSFPPGTLIHELLIGESGDFRVSRGILTTGLYVPVAMILPFVVLFYTVLGFLEDIGYLPRIATLMDNVMHRLGLHGTAVIPAILGMGCKVPGILATRILETDKQRFISATLIAVSIPCLAQMAVVIGLLSHYGVRYIALVYGTLLSIHIVLGLILNRLVKGESPEILLEIPPYRMPNAKTLARKIWFRVKYFLQEAVPYMFLGILAINVLYLAGFVDYAAKTFGPVLSELFGLPEEAVLAIIVGFMRKDAAVGMLAPIVMSPMQLTISCILLVTYFPCIATLITLYKELGVKNFIKTIALMLVVTLFTGILLKALFL